MPLLTGCKLYSMRIDKFLWCVRKYKTRSVATEEVRKEHVWLNGQKTKPSKEVSVQDEVSYKKEGIVYALRVLNLPKSRVGARLVEEYAEDCTKQEEREKAEFMGMMRRYNRQKGTGRPTKKERRHLDDFMSEDD